MCGAAERILVKNGPKLVAAERELRDRWLERVNADPSALPSEGKYDVSRAVTDQRGRANALPVARPSPHRPRQPRRGDDCGDPHVER